MSLDRLKPAYEVDIMQNSKVNLKDSNNSVIADSNCSTGSASTELKSKHGDYNNLIGVASPKRSESNKGNYATRSGRVVCLRFGY